ncbi:hypothetical protein [Rummeliibacillus pycnus]|uniref:hypothetical protein n=1 Tax=Rummeliibacillus pycnus TaxID=101070 RepID=UPI003D27BF91
MQFVIIIVFLALAADVIKVIVKNKNKRLVIEHSILQDEIKLEEIKQKNYMLETEKLRLELKQVQGMSSTKDELLDLKPIEPDPQLEPYPIQFK